MTTTPEPYRGTFEEGQEVIGYSKQGERWKIIMEGYIRTIRRHAGEPVAYIRRTDGKVCVVRAGKIDGKWLWYPANTWGTDPTKLVMPKNLMLVDNWRKELGL